MTVRAKNELYRALAISEKPKALWAKSNVTGEVQVQAIGYDGQLVSVFIPSSVGAATPRLINLLESAPVEAWRSSRSLMATVRLGHIDVTLHKKTQD